MSFPVGALVAAAPSIQRRLRKMSKYPREPRVFSHKKMGLTFGWTCEVLIAVTLIALVTSDEASRPDDATLGIILGPIMMVFCSWFLWVGYKRRLGVDNEKTWYRFPPFPDREVYFADITRIVYTGVSFGLYAGEKSKFFAKKKNTIGIAINVFDYTLAYLRILEEMRIRRFTIGKIEPHDPRWPEAWQDMRNRLAAEAYRNHQNYYDSHPAELQELNALTVGRFVTPNPVPPPPTQNEY
ncbi:MULTISPECIES: hypothetical protein [Actinotignum]|uniref:hypothetical protein n=1 Tax=Actinotignum TaxID=1653174 RepID=UPI002A820D32|nr:hypothetical protein [Actinotignum timonense]MDY5130479.1 hypothetical protein [Actinotignum timonense]MDY5135518.1 hypothetical protein [Actinotignum timonense]